MKQRLTKRELNYIVFLALIIGLTARFVSLFTDVWLDEIWSSIFSSPAHDLMEVLRLTLSDVHPPLYQTVLYYWYSVFGYTEFSGRFLSFFFGCVSLYGIYLLAKSVYSQYIAGIATVLFSTSIFALIYSSEIRSYALLLLGSIFSSYFFYEWVWHRNKTKVAYVICSALAFYSHYFGVILLLGHGLILLGILCEKRDGKLFQESIFVYLLLILAFVPLLPYVLQDVARDDFWIKQPQLLHLPIYLFVHFNLVVAPIILAMLVYVQFKYKPRWKQREYYLLMAAVSAVVIPWVIGAIASPMLVLRNTIIALPYWTLLSAYVLSAAGRKVQLVFIVFQLMTIIVACAVLPKFKGQEIDQVLQQAFAMNVPVYVINSGIINGGELNTIDFIQAKQALSSKQYATLTIKLRNEVTPIEKQVWLICYQTCERVNFQEWIPANYQILEVMEKRGITAYLLEQVEESQQSL